MGRTSSILERARQNKRAQSCTFATDLERNTDGVVPHRPPPISPSGIEGLLNTGGAVEGFATYHKIVDGNAAEQHPACPVRQVLDEDQRHQCRGKYVVGLLHLQRPFPVDGEEAYVVMTSHWNVRTSA